MSSTIFALFSSSEAAFQSAYEEGRTQLEIYFKNKMSLGRLQYLTKGGKNPLYYKPLSNCDVTLFADAYTKQMLTGPHMKTQLLVSR